MRVDASVQAGGRRAGVAAPGAGDVARHRSSGLRAHASVATTLRTTSAGKTRSAISTLRSDAPLALRPTLAKDREPWVAGSPDVARVCLTAGAAGPIGGDELSLDVDVGAGSSLVLAEIAPTLVLPGPHGERSHFCTRVRVGARGTLIWLPEPIIAVRGCDHVNHVDVDLDEGARLLMREELLLGRHGEETGVVRQSVRVRRGNQPLYRQDLDIGTPRAHTPAVIGGHRAVGSILVVEPHWIDHRPPPRRLPGDASLLPLHGPAALITAMSSDNLGLRAQLEAGLAVLGSPWDPRPGTDPRLEL